MTFRVSLLIDADGKAAVKEVRRVETAQKDAAKASEDLNRKSRGAAGGVDTLGTSAGAGAGRVDTMADANRRAAGSMANLTAQGNDVITMLLAGQDPLQLAIQQGTQINQVWGQMGVKGKDAFTLVGGALMSMVSPINLITIGSIAAAGAMTQWFASAGGEAKTLEDRLHDVEDAIGAWHDSARTSAEDVLTEFGGITREVTELNSALARLQLEDVLTAATAASRGLAESLSGGLRSRTARLEDLFKGSNLPELVEARVLELDGLMDQVANAGDIDEQIAAIEELQAALLAATGGFDRMSNAQLEFYRNTLETEDALRRAKAATDEQVAALKELGISMLSSVQEFLAARVEEYAQAQDMLDALEQQAELQRLIAVYGEDSAEVAGHRVSAERDVLAQKLETLGVAESIQQQVLDTYDQTVANEIATANWAGAMSGVAAEVRGILSALASIGGGVISNASKRIEIEALRAGKSIADARMTAAESQIEAEYRARDMAAGNWLEKATAWADREVQMNSLQLNRELSEERSAAAKREALANRKSSGGGSRGGGSSRASAADKEREAVEKLISGLEDQLAILRETDPVQKEMLRNRDALKGATEAEREAVRGLIETRLDEEEALERHADLADFIKSTGYDLFTGATQGADALTAAASRAAEALADAAFQALLLGEGPLAGILGGPDGGLLGGLADALAGALKGAPARAAGGMVGEPAPRKSDTRTGWRSIEARAAGGMVYGRGDGTSDDELTWLSSGEYVVNAKSTARNRGLLERINSGEDFPRFAAGGSISGGSTSPAAVQVSFSIDNRSSVPVQGEIEEVPAQGGGRAYKMVLSDMVGSALTTPGGAARRTLKEGFGVKPRRTKR